MKLFEIDEAIMECVNEDGEVVDVDRLNALEMEREKKVESVALWEKELIAEAKAIDEEIKRLQQRKKVDEAKAEYLKKWISYALGGTKFKTPKVSVSYRHSTSTQYTGNVENLADEYCKIERKPSLTAIKEALEQGIVIEGAALVENESVIIK